MKPTICLLLATWCLSSLHANDKNKIELNAPIPLEYLNEPGVIYLDQSVDYIIAEKKIYSTIGITFILNSAIKSQASIKEKEIGQEQLFANDSVLLPSMVISAYKRQLDEKNILLAADQALAKYTMAIKIYDHGFHWASSSTAGMFIRTKIELSDKNGEVVWEQYYCMDKKEAKIPHNRGAINMNKSIDKLIADYNKDPELLENTYRQIVDFLPPKMFED